MNELSPFKELLASTNKMEIKMPELGEWIKIDGKRPDWIDDDEMVAIKWGTGDVWEALNTPAYCVCGWDSSVTHIAVRADHPVYVVHPFVPGDYAVRVVPGDDYTIGKVYELLHDGQVSDDDGDVRTFFSEDYRHATEAEIAASLAPTKDGVWIERMTEAERECLYPHLDLNTLKDLRLIREETDIDRFTAETGIPVTADIEAAIKWARENVA